MRALVKMGQSHLILKIKKFDVSGKFRYDKKLPDRIGLIGQSYSLYSAEVKSRSGSPKLRNAGRKSKVMIDRKEHSGYKWLGFSDAVKKLTWRNQQKCLKIVDEWLRG